jgi:imidazolonepropionase-like amidohydrolase
MKRAMTLLALLPLACAPLALSAADSVLVIRGATVHTVSGADIPNGAVVVRNGKIEAVGAAVKAPAGAKIIEARGLHVYPGLIDAGTTMGLSEISSVEETNDVRELGDFNPQLRAASAVNPESEHIAITRANGVTTVVTSPAGSVIAGQAALINLAGWTIEEMAVRKSLGLVVRFPTIQIGGAGRGGGAGGVQRAGGFAEAKRNYDRQIQQLHDYLEQARHYLQARQAEDPLAKRDLKLEAMGPLLRNEQPALLSVSSARDVRNALDFADKEKIKIILMPGGGRGSGIDGIQQVAELLHKKNVAVILGPTLALPGSEDDEYDLPYRTPADLYKAGVKFCFGTFSTTFSRNLPFQAATAVAFGLPQQEALKAVTLNAAQIFGVPELGSIEPGKMANLIITDGDPLEARTQVKQLIINGQVTSTDNKHKRLYEKYLARP